MNEYNDETQLPMIWIASHILSIVLLIVKLFGFIPGVSWLIVIAPFIFDAILVLSILFGTLVLFFLFDYLHNDY